MCLYCASARKPWTTAPVCKGLYICTEHKGAINIRKSNTAEQNKGPVHFDTGASYNTTVLSSSF